MVVMRLGLCFPQAAGSLASAYSDASGQTGEDQYCADALGWVGASAPCPRGAATLGEGDKETQHPGRVRTGVLSSLVVAGCEAGWG